MKQTVVLFIIGCTVLGAAFAGAQNSASSDPAPGRSPGPPGVQQLSDSEHGEPADDAPPTFILTRDAAADDDNRSPLTSNDVLDASSDLEEKEADGSEQFTGDVSSESSSSSLLFGVIAASAKSTAHRIDEFLEGDQLLEPEPISANNPCSGSVDNYLKAEDEIVRFEAGTTEGSGGGGGSSQSLLLIDVTHDVFDTANGIVPGVIYRVEVRRPEQSEIRDFYIESLEGAPPSTVRDDLRRSRSRAVGNFLDSNQQSNSVTHPTDGLRVNIKTNTWIDDLEADWVSGHHHHQHHHREKVSSNVPKSAAGKQSSWEQDAVRWNSIQPNVEAYFEEGDGADSEEFEGTFQPSDCPGNVWKQELMFSNRMVMNWSVTREEGGRSVYSELRDSISGGRGEGSGFSLGDSDQRNRTAYFRILYRTMTSHIVYELNYPMVLLKECNLLLKETSGSLDSSKLPAEYDNCRIGFPTRLEDNQLAADGDRRHSPPGLVVQLTRLNIPCRSDGGYLKFIESISDGSVDGRDDAVNSGGGGGGDTEGHFLCGKLEELPKSDRTFHFQKHRSTALLVHNRPVFSFNFRLVDYCYNVTISDRNSSVLLRPLRGLDCRFRIHLPFGNRVSLRLNANGVAEASNSSTIKHEQIDLGVPQGNSYESQCYNGLRVEVYEQPQNRWVRCIDSYSDVTEYTLLSSDNSLVIHVSKYSLLAALEAAVANDSSSRTIPSLLIEHDAQPIESVISQCAFGWIASSQFCIAAFESQRLSWHGAEQECNRLGGHLASIRSVSEQKLVDQLLLKSPNYKDGNAYWIGASDRTLEGDFRWSDSLPFMYSNWFPGWIQMGNYNRQPNDDGLSEQDCVEIRRQFQTPPSTSAAISSLTVSYMWNDRDCATQNHFLCERVVVEEALEKTWREDCNKTVTLSMDQPKATIWSPRFPRPYPDNVNCLTIITAPPGYRIVLDFEELVLESEPLCAYDYLQILEPPANYSSAYTKPSRSLASVPLFQARNPRHSTSRFYVRRRKSNPPPPPSKIDIGDRLMATFASKAPNLILQPDDPSYNLRIPPPDLNVGRVPRKVCGDWSSKLKLLRHVSKGALLGLRFISDYSNHFGGYKAKVAMENVISECYDERFQAYNASCYLFISFPQVDWMTAQQVCRGIGAQLASISTTDEQRFITTSIRNSLDYTPRAMYWVGGELADTGMLEWADGAKLMFEGWLPGQRPDPKKMPKASPSCLGLQWKISPTPMISSGLHWSVQKCTTGGGYVCKKPRPTAVENMAKNQTLTGTEGRLLSPNYPNPYPARTDYWIRLEAPENNRIIIQFQTLDIEQQEECLYDYVSIQNFQVLPGPELNPGTNPFPMAMYWDRAEDLSSADYSNDQPFANLLKGDYYQEQNSSPRKEERFQRKRSLPLNDDIQQKLQDNIKLLEKINSKLKDRKKRFLSSDNYKTVKNSNQSIALETSSVDSLDTSYTGPSFLPYVRWCGTHDSNMSRFNFISDGNEAFLRFHSDYSVSGSGYSATWSTVDISGCPIQTLTSREGSIHSPNYPHFLLNNLDCTYVIQAPFGKKVWLEFDFFDILQDAIVNVDISDGPFVPFRDENHLNDGVFLSKGERMVVRLKTGALPRGKGFHASFRTLGAAVEQRSINLENKTAGNLFHLNYPQTAPFELDFTQHLIAPLGAVILLELHGVGFSEHGCHQSGFIEISDNYADRNGTLWHLCDINHSNASAGNAYSAEYRTIESNLAKPAPIYITSYLNTLHIRQRNVQGMGVRLNATIRLQSDIGYKMKLITNDEEWVESCKPNPCQSGGKCVMQKDRGICHCRGHFTGRFCALNMCELEPCYFGKCELTQSSFKCLCQPGYMGQRCDEKPKPCEDNPCEGRGECHPKNGGFFCRCHAWWEGPRCEKRMMRIPYKPLSERMLQEPFWLGLITVFVVLAVIGLVWCAKRHFPEKIEKLLADEAHRNRSNFPPHHLNTALREQLQATAGTVPSSTATTPATHRTIFGRLGIRKPSILSLSSPQQVGGATARTFSLDDLLRPPPRRTPSPRKKRNNSTPTKKNANEKKQILQQLVSPAPNSATKQVSLGELIQLSENRLKVNHAESESDIKETTFSDHSLSVSSIVRQISDPKLEKKVTFARLLSKVSAEISSGSDDLANGSKHCSALSLPTEVTHRASSVPQSPSTNEIRSPHSTSSNQGSDSLSSSELALHDFGLRGHRRTRPKVSSADSILAMFKNFATSSAGINLPSSIVISPSSTPTASSPQDDVAGDDDSSTSSAHTPVSFSSGAPDSPVFYRQSTIEVPVLDALSAHKTTPTTTAAQLHPPTILLEIPSINNKCLSPIREMPTPIPSPALTPIMPRPHRIRTPQNLYDESMSVTFSGDYSGYNNSKPNQVTIEINHPDSDTDSPTPMNMSSQSDSTSSNGSSKCHKTPPKISISIDVQPPTPKREKPERPRDLVIPELIIQQPSPTKERSRVVIFPGSPPPQRASIGETSFLFPNKEQQKRLLKQWEKPGSLDLPFEPPMITITSNMSEVESDADCMSPAATGKPHLANRLGVTGSSVGMCYLSPFSMCTRGDRAPSESNLSSSGYSSMASPGPSRCGSSNPLCPSEMEDPGAGPPGTSYHGLNSMLGTNRGRQTSILKKHSESGGSGTAAGGATDRHEAFRQRSDSETLSDDPLLESNDEGIGTDHLDEKIEDGEIRSAKELEIYIGHELIETGQSILNQEVASMSQLQLPSIVIQSESGFDKLSPVSSRSESPLSDRTISMERFSPLFYGKKDQQLPFTDSDGLYDFPSSDGKGSSTTHHRKSTGRRRERRSSRSGPSLSPSKSTSVLLEIPGKDKALNQSNSVSSHIGPKLSCATPTRKSPKRRPLYRHPVASSSSSTESLTSTREYAQRSSKAAVTYTKETNLYDSGDDTGEPETLFLPSTMSSLSTTTTTAPTKSKQPEVPPRFACADTDIFQRLLSYKLNRLSSSSGTAAVSTQRSTSKQSSSFGSYSYTRIGQFDDSIDFEDDDDDNEEADAFFRKDVSSQILPTVTVEEMNKPKSKIGRLKAIGNQIRFLRRLERSIQRKDRQMVISDEDGSSSRDSPRVTSPLLKNLNHSPAMVVASGSRPKSTATDPIVVVEPPSERTTPFQQLLAPSSAVGSVKSRQNFKMSRQKRVANSRGGGYNEQQQPWLEREREHRLLGSGDVNSD
ncbi:uncharacterized protein LOC131683943 isoform X3 [Topomyia yanbarensis]|uniref:uncharacterized protein LOC131683943 isoform X3 n=1 Tax=Topomyia yanbarensis TaxID=2498891 RepID=UPI00273CED85|nr:uncharacterized protein LOC131683943 isoform X3 [Topomyia yanbarensis]